MKEKLTGILESIRRITGRGSEAWRDKEPLAGESGSYRVHWTYLTAMETGTRWFIHGGRPPAECKEAELEVMCTRADGSQLHARCMGCRRGALLPNYERLRLNDEYDNRRTA